MNGRAVAWGGWQEERGRPAPMLAALLVAALMPLVFDYVPDSSPVAGLWAAALLGLGWWLCGFAPAATVSRCRTLFATAFALRIVVTLLLVHFDFWQDDEIVYHEQAQFISLIDLLKRPGDLWDLGIRRYAVLCQAVYLILGHETIGPRLLNAWFGSLTGVAIYLIANRQENRRWAVHAGWLVALFPDLVLYSGFELKDIGVAFGITLFTLGLVEREQGRRGIGQWGLLLVGTGLASFLRLFVVAPLAVGFFWKLLDRVRQVGRRALAVAALLVAVDMLVLVVSPSASLLNGFLGTMSGLHVTMFSSGGVDDLSFFNAFDAGYTPLSIVMSFAYVFLVPFIVWPFTNEGAIYKMLAPGTFVWYAAMPFVARGVWHLEEKGARGVFAMTATTVLALALGGGFHATGRHRVMIMPILLMFAARGYDDFRRGDKWARRLVQGYVAALALGLAYYCSVKGL